MRKTSPKIYKNPLDAVKVACDRKGKYDQLQATMCMFVQPDRAVASNKYMLIEAGGTFNNSGVYLPLSHSKTMPVDVTYPAFANKLFNWRDYLTSGHCMGKFEADAQELIDIAWFIGAVNKYTARLYSDNESRVTLEAREGDVSGKSHFQDSRLSGLVTPIKLPTVFSLNIGPDSLQRAAKVMYGLVQVTVYDKGVLLQSGNISALISAWSSPY